MKKCKHNTPLEERLLNMSRVNPESGCRECTRYKRKTGYGLIGVAGKVLSAHRVAYEIWVGAIPAGMFVCHHCDNPSCINPEHLFIGNHKDNAEDKVSKGRQYHPIGEIHGRAKVTEDQVMKIREITGKFQREIAEMFGIDRSQVSDIRNNRTWKHLLPKDNVINQSV